MEREKKKKLVLKSEKWATFVTLLHWVGKVFKVQTQLGSIDFG